MQGRRFGLLAAAGCVMLSSWAARAAETTIYQYDELGRLKGVTISGTVNSGQATAITYDATGNRGNYTVTGVPTGTPTIAISGGSATEGAGLVFTVTRTGNPSIAVGVSFASVNGTATAPADYTAVSGTLSFLPGDLTKTVTVTTVDDAAAETSETFTVALSTPTGGAVLGVTSATGTIVDNDAP